MKRIFLFIGNFLVAIIFGWDVMSYYMIGGINIINNDVNRVFIMWIGFLVSSISSCWFLTDHLNKKNKSNQF